MQAREAVFLALFRTPGGGERLGQGRFLLEQLDARGRGCAGAPRARRGRRRGAGRGARGAAPSTNGSHDSMPSNCSPWARRSQTPAPHGRLRNSCSAAAATRGGHGHLAAPVQRHAGQVALRALVAHREGGEPVDLVAPQVDADGLVRGRAGTRRRSRRARRTRRGARPGARAGIPSPRASGADPPRRPLSRSDQLRRRVLERPEPLEQRTHRGHHDPWRREPLIRRRRPARAAGRGAGPSSRPRG